MPCCQLIGWLWLSDTDALLCMLLSPIGCRLQMGLSGAALAFTCSQGTTALLLVLYTVWRDARMAARQHEEATWCRPGWAVFAGERGRESSFSWRTSCRVTIWCMAMMVIPHEPCVTPSRGVQL